QGLTLALAESCTGGLIASLLTTVAGSSDYFPGGVIAYVTCSPHPEETAAVVADAHGATLLDAAAHLPEVPDAAAGNLVQLWPHRHGTDAMFLALLRREGGPADR
ncbi:MAG: CinA family protein, partial [Actinobacteria bacterium]|nr:CinA family protein [Actinomycetota bacterium]